MLFDLIKMHRGKEHVIMTDVRRKVQTRLRQLTVSQKGNKIKGYRVAYEIRESAETERYKQKPSGMWNEQSGPQRVQRK